MNLNDFASQQERTLAGIADKVSQAEAKIGAIDPQLKREVIDQRAAAIRDESVRELEGLRREMVERVAQAKAMLRRYTPEAIRRSARFHDEAAVDATMRLAVSTRLSRTPTAELLDHLEDAVDANNLALAEAVRLEFSSRADVENLRHDFVSRFSRVKTPAADEGSRLLNRVIGLGDMGDERMVALMRGHSDPVRRLTIARSLAPRAA